LLLDLPIRALAAEPQHADTRIPQISLMLDAICVSSLVVEPEQRVGPIAESS